jgi:AAA ATPase domain
LNGQEKITPVANEPDLLPLRVIRNPFVTQVVADPWARAEADVPHINRAVFELSHDLVEETGRGSGSTCLLMYGEAGSGKTHLLSRLRAHLESHSEAVFVSVRLQTVAPRIWRHIRRALAVDLLRPQGNKTRLDHLLAREGPPIEERLGFAYGLATVLNQFQLGRYRSHCAAWLRGEPLPESIIQKLELAVEDDEELSLEDQSNQVVLQLCRLMSPLPVVFCFDQVEALETVPGDLTGLYAFGKAVADLYAELNNLVAISAMQSSFATRLEEKLDRYMYDRLSLHRAEIQPLNWKQGAELIATRLEADPDLAKLRALRTSDDLWPLKESQLTTLFGPHDLCTARRLIHAAAEQFEAARGSVHPDKRSVPQFLDEEFAARREKALGALPADVEELLLSTLPFLLGSDFEQQAEPFLIATPRDSKTPKIALQMLNQPHPTSLVTRLKKIQKEWNPAVHPPLIVVRDARLPIRATAVKTREILADLRRRGAHLVQPSPEVLAALEAFRSLLADAQTGNLVHLGQDVEASAVQQWFTSNLPPVVEDFLEDLAPKPAPENFVGDLLDFLEVCSIVRLEEAAQALGAAPEQLSEYARHHPLQIGFLAGPPAVLFRAVPHGHASAGVAGDPEGAD